MTLEAMKEQFRVPGPICTSKTDAAFYAAFHEYKWTWVLDGPGQVILPDGQRVDHGEWIHKTGDVYEVFKA